MFGMASAKATFSLIALVLVLAVVGVGGAYLARIFQTRAVQKDLKAAATALTEHRPKDAEQLLVSRLDRAQPSTGWAADALALRFRALEELNDSATAAALAQKSLNTDKPWVRPGDEAWARAHLVLANVALANNLGDQARQHLEAVLSQPPRGANDPVLDEAQMGLARIELATGKIEAGRDRLAALQARLANDSALKPRVERILGEVNSRILFDPQPYGRDQIHVLAKGDSLDKLSKQYKISVDLLMGINHIPDPRKLRIGRRLKIPDLQLSMVVDKANNTLTVYNYGKFFKRYTVRTGKDEFRTPQGEFTILMKAKDPAWFNRDLNHTVPAGDPTNELGARWLGFQGTSLGIHEARDPGSLGKYSSNGCVGMARQDVMELYDMVSVGTPLKIVGQMNPALMETSTATGFGGLGTAPAAGSGGLAGGLPSPASSGNAAPTPAPEDAGAVAVPEGALDATATPAAGAAPRNRHVRATKPAGGAAAPGPAFGQ
jgi:tetratricopeptide (TPR) repeat protein